MPTTYTFTQKTPAPEGSGGKTESHYMNQPVDGSRIAVQGIGNGPMTSDATGTPVTSPASVLTSGVTTLLTPESAVQITICPLTNPVRVCEVSTSMSTYFQIPAGVPVTIDVSNCAALYLEAITGTSVVSFFYTMI
jgi:hypothetical protein